MLNKKMTDLEYRMRLLVESVVASQDELWDKLDHLRTQIIGRCHGQLAHCKNTCEQWLEDRHQQITTL